MAIFLLALYLKFNLLLAASFLLWLMTKLAAKVFGFELNHARQLGMARCLLSGVLFVVPLAVLVEQLIPGVLAALVSGLSGHWLAGEMLVTGDIDTGLAQQYGFGGLTLQLGSLILVLLLAGFLIQLQRMRRQVQLLRQVVTQATLWKQLFGVEMLFSPTLGTPFSSKALGRKQIVLPYQLLQSPRNLRLAVKHELQHLRNGDLDWVLLLEALKLLCFWNPAAWLWHNEFDCLQEFACDEVLVGRRRVGSNIYGTCLLEVASASSGHAMLAISNMVPVFSWLVNRESQLKRRILMLSNNNEKRHATMKSVCYGVLAGSTLFGASLLVLAAETAPTNTPPERQAERREYLPITVKQPQYPQSALRDRQEGWAQVQFTVDKAGNPVDEEVVDNCAGPTLADCEGENDVFDSVSLDAIRQFKFEPRMEGGVAVATPGVQYVFRFTLNKESDDQAPADE